MTFVECELKVDVVDKLTYNIFINILYLTNYI